MVYPGNRKYLPKDSAHRRNKVDFPSKAVEHTAPPKNKIMEYIDKANKDYELATTASERKCLTQISGCKGTYALRAIEGHDRVLDTPVDPMHVIKNVVEHSVKLIVGEEDSLKVRQQEQSSHRFRSAWFKAGQTKLTKAPFTLTKEKVTLADQRLKQVRVPSGFDWNSQPFFSKPFVMKSHQWKQVATHGVLKYCLRGMLGSKQQQSLFKLFDVLTSLCAEQSDLTTVDALESKVHEVLVLIERDFPLSIQVIVFHLLHHLPMYICRFGPVYNFWMFPYERFNSWVTRQVLGRRYPESTVVETYRLSEWAHFMEASCQLPEGSTLTTVATILEQQQSAESVRQVSEEYDLPQEQLAEVLLAYESIDLLDCTILEIPNTACRLKSATLQL